MFNGLDIASTVNKNYVPEQQTRIDVAQSMQTRLNNNLQKKQQQQQQQQEGNINIPGNMDGWGTVN